MSTSSPHHHHNGDDDPTTVASLRSELSVLKRELLSVKKEIVEIYRSEENHEGYGKPSLATRVLLFSFLAAYIILSSKALEWRDHVSEIFDLGHYATESLSDWMTVRPHLRDPLIAAHGVAMDALCAFVAYLNLFHDDTMSIHVALFSFYTFRNIAQNVMRFPLPDKWRFHDPGFPSILVSYDEVSDFYFSGHVGSILLAAFDFQRRGWTTCARLSFAFSALIAVVVITTRAHYTVDVIDGVVFAFLSCRIAHNYVRYVDHFFGSFGSSSSNDDDSDSDPLSEKSAKRIEALYEAIKRTEYRASFSFRDYRGLVSRRTRKEQ